MGTARLRLSPTGGRRSRRVRIAWVSHAVTAGADYPPEPANTGERSPAENEQVVAKEWEKDAKKETEHDEAAGKATDSSPYDEVRAQPGDVLGLETGGERTYVGDTAEDEDKRRRDAEKAAPKS